MLPFLRVLLVALVGSLLATSIQADDRGYIGLAAGRASERDALQGVRIDASEVGVKLFGGYHLLEVFSIEASFTEFNEFVETTDEAVLREGVRNGAIWGRIDPPIGERVFFIAKLGVAHTRTRVRLERGPDEIRDDRSDTAVAWGLGFGARLTDRVAVQVEYDAYQTETVANLELISLGVLIRF